MMYIYTVCDVLNVKLNLITINSNRAWRVGVGDGDNWPGNQTEKCCTTRFNF